MSEEAIEFGELELDRGDGGVNLRPPLSENLVDRCSHLL
jgi:hypothetical protein